MKKLFFFSVLILPFVLMQCKPVDRHKQEILKEIGNLEPFVYGDTVSTLNTAKASELMNNYSLYAETYPADTICPEYLFRAAELAMNLKMPGKSIELFQIILNHYPDHEKAPYSLFMQAFIYENQLSQFDLAKSLYQRFVEQYPNHELARDAQVSIDYMGKPLEELIKSWEKSE